MELRHATGADAEAIREIYNREVTETTNTFDIEPRSLAEQKAWIAEREGALGVLVAEIDGAVAGFASLSEFRPRPAYRTTVESSVYVAESARGAGVGRELMVGLVDVATKRGFHTIVANIAGGHEASIALHHAAGFEIVGTQREVGRKMGAWLDLVVMQRMLA
ncbi:MAG: GNAT family N-acetyltransferase [Acidimicrobiales bacterium]|jgi:phosphinothricin acetyltransferase|nr:GNAT family N-acetyltransferase [Acidimicrobiales bacterium]